LLWRRVLSRKSGNRNGRLVVPIKVEFVGYFVDHRPDNHHVEIDKIHRFIRPKIFIADIAAANDRDLPIGSEGLVMHPPVDASEVGDHTEESGRTQDDGVEHPHLDVRMTVDSEQDGVGGRRTEIVEQ
jgi:hypothetical protein